MGSAPSSAPGRAVAVAPVDAAARWSSRWPSTTTPARRRSSTADAVDRAAARGAGRADPARAGASGVLRLGDHRCRASTRCSAGITELLPAGRRRRRRRSPARCSRSSAGRPARRSPTSGCSRAPARPRPAGLGGGGSTRSPAIEVFDAAAAVRATWSRPAQIGQLWGLATSGSATPIGTATRGRRGAPLRAAEPGDGRRTRPAGRRGALYAALPSSPSRTR